MFIDCLLRTRIRCEHLCRQSIKFWYHVSDRIKRNRNYISFILRFLIRNYTSFNLNVLDINQTLQDHPQWYLTVAWVFTNTEYRVFYLYVIHTGTSNIYENPICILKFDWLCSFHCTVYLTTSIEVNKTN